MRDTAMSGDMRHTLRLATRLLLAVLCCMMVMAFCAVGRAHASDGVPADGSNGDVGACGVADVRGGCGPVDVQVDGECAGEKPSAQLGAVLYDDGGLLICRTDDAGYKNALSAGEGPVSGEGPVNGGGSSAPNGGEPSQAKNGAGADGEGSFQVKSCTNAGGAGAGATGGAEPPAIQDGGSELAGNANVAGRAGSSNGKHAVAAVYGQLPDGATAPEQLPWHGQSGRVRTVSFGDDVAPASMAFWFSGFCGLSDVDFAGLDTRNVTSMQSLFEGCKSLEKLDVSSFDTSSVTNMSRLFADCSALGDVDLSHFDTRNVTSMDGMFAGCSSMSSIDLSGLDVGKVSSVSGMLSGCTSLAALDASSFSASQVKAMAVPVDNAGGFWRLNVPEGYDPGITLREPTAAERAAAGLPAENEGGGKSTAPVDGQANSGDALVPSNSTSSEGQSLVADDAQAASSAAAATLSSTAAASALTDAIGLGAQTAWQGAEVAGVVADAIVSTADGDGEVARVDARPDGEMAELATSASGVISRMLSMSSQHLLSFLNPISSQIETLESLVKLSPVNPMTPFGISLSLLATIVLLVTVVPFAALVLRDRRF